MRPNRNTFPSFLFGFFVAAILFILSHEHFPRYFHDIKSHAKSKEEISKWRIKNIRFDLDEVPEKELIEYGYLLITNTSEYIGPLSSDPIMKYAGNNLACNNCHLDAGRKIGSGSFVGITNRFPQFRGRENKIGTLKERINGCMERSMNGKKLPQNSKEIEAILAYMKWLSEDVPPDIEQLYKGYVSIEIPEYPADPKIGKSLYNQFCQRCHMEQGEGFKAIGKNNNSYMYPPLGGHDSYNDGAGMNRVLTAAQFIKANMPFGATYDRPILSDEEAYHIAAYINTLDRPQKERKEQDFPDKKLKPVSTPYGPWADDFEAQQHKFGPFPPIIKYYKETFGIQKNK